MASISVQGHSKKPPSYRPDGPGADAAAILVEGDVAYMMMPVLDRPTGAVEFEETLGVRLPQPSGS